VIAHRAHIHRPMEGATSGGMTVGLDRLPAAVCTRDGTRLRSRMDTNGAGQTFEFVEPCPACRADAEARGRRFAAVPEPEPAPAPVAARPKRPRRARGPVAGERPVRRCLRCGEPIPPTGKSGRPRTLCARCR